MSRLFKRFLQLSLIKPNPQFFRTPYGFWAQAPNALIIREMRVRFKIEKNLGKHPNRASVTITNLASDTIKAIQKLPLIVQLDVVYDGAENLQRLFSGDLRIADTVHNGPDVDTKLEMGEGDRAYQFGHVSKSYDDGTPLLNAVRDVTAALGMAEPAGLGGIREFQSTISGGLTLHGPAHQAMTTLLTPAGFGWSMQEGKLVLLKGTQVRENQAVVVKQGDGMVGSPVVGAGKKPGEAPRVHVKTLIDPRIVAGCKIDIQSRDVTGLCRVEKLEHTGDYRGKEWYTDIKARKL